MIKKYLLRWLLKDKQLVHSAFQESLDIRDASSIIEEADSLDRMVRSYGLQNEQWFLDWQDKLNAISVR